MEEDRLYTIGEVSKICNISKKALRFYDSIDIISPDYISEENGYRYYSRETLLFVPVIKYFKQMGFKLEEMKELLNGDTYQAHERAFRKKIEELDKMRRDIQISHISVQDWYNLIIEAESVLDNNATEVSVKYLDVNHVCYMEQKFENNYKELIINIEWTNYLEEINHPITGAVHIEFLDLAKKIKGESCRINIFQCGAQESDEKLTKRIGGEMVLSAYHIGPHDTINETYEKIFRWAESNGYKCGNSSIERYVTDYWTIKKEEEFVTEVMVEIVK